MNRFTIRSLLFFSLSAALMSAETGASLGGSVKDPQGRPVSGATLTLFSRSGAAGASTTSDSSGAYRFEGLPGGDYLLRADNEGFAPAIVADIHLGPGSAEKRDVALSIAGVRAQVVVTASSTPQAPDQVAKPVTAIDQADADLRDASALSDVVNLAPAPPSCCTRTPGARLTTSDRAEASRKSASPWSITVTGFVT